MTERKWCVVQHVPFEGPGLIVPLARERGLQIEVCRAYEDRPLPDPGQLGGLVVMGGPMGVADSDLHPHLCSEVELISAALERSLPILGVCLGAQLLAHTLGAKVYPGARAEIGAGHVKLNDEGRRDRILGGGEDERIPVFHWHGETFDLPDKAVCLAASELYRNQAFRFGERAYGLQFHVELDRSLAHGWVEHLPAGVQISEDSRVGIERAGRRILGAFFDLAAARG